jgi:cytochrome c-type biogenesis protein CcmF
VENVDEGKNITLIKGRPMFMNGYWVTYNKDTIYGTTRKFDLSFVKLDENQDTSDFFTLRPNVLFDNKMTKLASSNPDTKHFLSKDIFTYIHSLPAEQMNVEDARRIEEELNYETHRLGIQDTLETALNYIWLEKLTHLPNHSEYKHVIGDLCVGVTLKARRKDRDAVHSSNAMVVLRKSLVYRFGNQINDLNLRFRLPDEAISVIYPPEENYTYESFILKEGQSTQFDQYTIQLNKIEREVSHINYEPLAGDIALNAVLEVFDGKETLEARPLYLIRDNKSYSMEEFLPSIGGYLSFEKIDPVREEFYFTLALSLDTQVKIPIEIAEDAPRDDIIVLEAIEFPGINLFWLGSILILLGLFIGAYRKIKTVL